MNALMLTAMIAQADTSVQCTVPPSNAGFYHAAYVVIAVLYGGYSLSLWWRRRSMNAMRAVARANASAA